MCEPHSGLILDDSVWLLSVFSLVLCVAGLRRDSSARRLLCLRVVMGLLLFFSGRVHRHRQREARVQHGAGTRSAFVGGGGFRANLLPLCSVWGTAVLPHQQFFWRFLACHAYKALVPSSLPERSVRGPFHSFCSPPPSNT